MTSSPKLHTATSRNVLSSFQSSDPHTAPPAHPLSYHLSSDSSRPHPSSHSSHSHPSSHATTRHSSHSSSNLSPSLHPSISFSNLIRQSPSTVSDNGHNDSSIQNTQAPSVPLSSKVSHIDVRNLRSRDCISKDLADIRRRKEIEKKENKLLTHKYELLSRAYCYKEQTLPKNHDKYNKIDSKIYNKKDNKYKNNDRNYISSSMSYKSKDTRIKTNYIHDLQNISDRNERSGTPGCVLDCMQTLGVLVWNHPGVRPNRYGIKIFDVNLSFIFSHFF